MDAVISARASAFALINGNECRVGYSNNPNDLYQVDFGLLKYPFGGATDTIHIKGAKQDDVVKTFNREVLSEEIFHLLLILLDGTQDVDIRHTAAEELESVFADKSNVVSAKNIFYSLPLPEEADVHATMELTRGMDRVQSVLSELLTLQPLIGEVRGAWDSVQAVHFASNVARQDFLTNVVRRGAFRQFVEILASDPGAFNSALVQVLQDVKDQRNYRAVVSEWAAKFKRKPQDIRDSLRIVAQREAEEERRKDGRRDYESVVKGYEAFQRVQAQQDAIRAHIRAGNVRLARKFTEELVSSQTAANQQSLAAKSLCKLSQFANSAGQYSLQLEWAKRATELSPDDSIAHGHLADAYIFLNRFDEALAELDTVARLGDERFAATNRARILKQQGRLDEALGAFLSLRTKYGNEPGNAFAWNGYAEVLRDMWNFGKALVAYEEAVEAFPDEVVTQSGRAAVLAELGRLEESRDAYDSLLRLGARDTYALVGRAYVAKLMGQLDESLALYQRAIVESPMSASGFTGLASVQRLMRRFEDALTTLSSCVDRFPHEPAVACEVAEVFRDQGRLNDALEIFKQSRAEFPWDTRVSNGFAQVNKDLGRFAEALQIYDQGIARFPYDVASRMGRADCLKRLARFEDSLDAYEDVIGRWPENIGLRHSKAAVLVILERYEEAEALLPKAKPQTIQDWIAYHVRGMILLKRKQVPAAIDLFRASVREIPFAEQRQWFQSALAVALLKQKNYAEVPDLSLTKIPLSNVLLLHAFAASGKRIQANTLFQKVEAANSAQIIELGQEIARRYKLKADPPKHDEEWIFQQECQSILLEAA